MYSITLFALFPLAFKMYVKLTSGVCKSYRRIDGQTVIITGANIGIGLEAAKNLARRGGKIILACRNLTKGRAAINEIQRETGSTSLVLKQLDLSSFKSVRNFAKEILAEETRLDILINNAGAATLSRTLTENNLETNMQSNHFAPFLLTHLLLDLMRKTEKSRIVNIASMAYVSSREFDIDNLNAEKSFSPMQVYGHTKLANIYFTNEPSRRLRRAGISNVTVNSVHPGGVRTAFHAYGDDLWFYYITHLILRFFFKTAAEGVQTTLHVAISEEVDGLSGEFFSDCQKHWTLPFCKNVKNAELLWEKSVTATSLKKEETIFDL